MTYTSEYPIISVTVDAVVFRNSIEDGGKCDVLVIRRKNEPFKDYIALPGGFLNPDETAERAAIRELNEETGVTGSQIRTMEALSTRSAPGRDPRGPVVSLPYCMVVPWYTKPKAGDDASEAFWLNVKEAVKADWAFDHAEIFGEAVKKFVKDFMLEDMMASPLTKQERIQRIRDRAAKLPKGPL